MYTSFFIDDDISGYFIKWLTHFQEYPHFYQDRTNHCLSPNCFATKNILEVVKDKEMEENLNFLKNLCQEYISDPIEYFYVHMIDYKNGGDMLIHKHDHNEDYSFILYLNDCDDGYTTLYLENPIRIQPERSKILVFSSDVYHSAMFSKEKKILVGGLKIRQ
jgi:hypothetical protein